MALIRPLLLAAALTALPALAGTPPRVFFTDLESGPSSGGENGAGTILTLYGRWFGSTQGSSTVTVGGGPVAAVLAWGGKAGGAVGLETLSVAIGSAAQTGPVVVHTAAGTSNTDVVFTVRPGNIYCVSTAGSNSDTGLFPSHCWADLVQAKSTMAGGDITYALHGVTQTSIDNYSSSFSISVGGAQGAPMAVVAYPGATVTIGDNSIELGTRTPNISGAFDHWVLAGLTLRGKSALAVGWTDYRIVGNDISCDGSSQWGCVQPYGDSQKYLGNNIHDTGQNCGVNPNTCKLYHAVYFGVTNHVEFAWNDVNPDPQRTGVAGCRALQFHTTDNSGLDDSDVHVHDNVIRNAICDGMNLVTVDPDMGPVEVYNNVVYHVGTGPAPAGVESDYACLYTDSNHTPAAAVEVFNNTFYDCGSRGNSSSGAFTSVIPTHLRNNLVMSVGASEPYLASSGTGCPVVSGANNLFLGAGAPPSCPNLSGSMNVDPMFVSVSGFDFHLQAQSPARNAGVTITTLPVDLDGVPRPQGNAFSLGAYEYNTGYVPPPLDAGTGTPDAGSRTADAGRGGGGDAGTPADAGGLDGGGPNPGGGMAKEGCGCQGSSGAISLAALLGCIALALKGARRLR